MKLWDAIALRDELQTEVDALDVVIEKVKDDKEPAVRGAVLVLDKVRQKTVNTVDMINSKLEEVEVEI